MRPGFEYWTAPAVWPGETVYVVGGGPSLRDVDLSCLPGPGRVIAVNDSYLLLDADYVLYTDSRWLEWQYKSPNRDRFMALDGRLVTASQVVYPHSPKPLRMRRQDLDPPSFRPDTLCGKDSGIMAANLAIHLSRPRGRIVLLGFDMRFGPAGETHWHGGHPMRSALTAYEHRFAPQYRGFYERAMAAGYTILTGTPSALTFIPLMDLRTGRRIHSAS